MRQSLVKQHHSVISFVHTPGYVHQAPPERDLYAAKAMDMMIANEFLDIPFSNRMTRKSP